MMLYSMRCLWQNLRRVHHILKTLEKELEKQRQLASLSAETEFRWSQAVATEEMPA